MKGNKNARVGMLGYLTQENARLRKSGGQSGHRAEKALYSTPKF
jgi:hypothetical protein